MDIAQAIDLAAAPAKSGPRNPHAVLPPASQGQMPMPAFTLAPDLPDSAAPGALVAVVAAPELGGEGAQDEGLTDAPDAAAESGAEDRNESELAEVLDMASPAQAAADVAAPQSALLVLPATVVGPVPERGRPQQAILDQAATRAPAAQGLQLPASPPTTAVEECPSAPAAAPATVDAKRLDDSALAEPRTVLRNAPPATASPSAAGQPAAPFGAPDSGQPRPDNAAQPDQVAQMGAGEDISPLAPQGAQAERVVSSSPLAAAPQAHIANRAQHVAGQIAAAISSTDSGQIELRLDPPELGRLLMQLQMRDGEVSAIVTVERGETLDLMRRHADILTRELARAGLGAADLSFRAQSDQHSERQSRGSGQDGALHPAARAEGAPVRVGDVLAGRIALIDGTLDIRL